MITNPAETWEWYAKAGAARIAFHPDAADDPAKLLQAIASAGLGPGIAVNPDVDVASVEELVGLVDHVIVMSVHPGFSGQKFISDVLPKFGELRERGGPRIELLIDGGVSLETAPACLEAGADLLVSASAIFGSPDPRAVAEELAKLATTDR